MDHTVALAFVWTLLAGLATAIGSAIGVLARRTDTRSLSVGLGFSAGAMIFAAFGDLFPSAEAGLAATMGEDRAALVAGVLLVAGMLVSALLDVLIPSPENPHEAALVEDMGRPPPAELRRLGIWSAAAIAIHNFPEGIATLFTSLNDLTVGATIALAIAIHNIPEGLAVAVPVYHATGSRKKAFWLSAASGLSEPLGALLGYLFLRPFATPAVLAGTSAVVAGIMLFVAVDQLVPNAKRYDTGHASVWGLLLGVAVMAAARGLA